MFHFGMRNKYTNTGITIDGTFMQVRFVYLTMRWAATHCAMLEPNVRSHNITPQN